MLRLSILTFALSFVTLISCTTETASDPAASAEVQGGSQPDSDSAGPDIGDIAADVSSPDAPAPEEDASVEPLQGGTRLGALWYSGAEEETFLVESSLHAGWWDGTLKAECRFVETTPGLFHCVPVDGGGLLVFSTSTCDPSSGLMALLVSGSNVPNCEPRYVWHGFEDARCPKNTRGAAFRITGPATASLESHGYVQSYFGTCNARPAPPPLPDPGPDWVYCTVESVPIETFVAANPKLRTVGDVRVRTLEAEDGTIAPQSIWSLAVDVPLVQDYWTGNELIPDAANFAGGTYTDESCTAGAVCTGESDGLCANVVVVQSGECSGTPYLLGEPVSEVFSCSPIGDLPKEGCRALGEPLAKVAYEEIALGTSRLRPQWVALDGTPLLPTGYFHDHELNVDCWVGEDPDGVVRCLPVSRFGASGPPNGWRQVYGSVNDKGQCESILGYVYYPRCSETPGPFLSRAGELLRMTARADPMPSVVYAGVGPPGEEVYNCGPLPAGPSALYDATPVGYDTFAELKRTGMD